MKLLDFIRKQRSDIRRALQAAPAEVEEALLKDRDIKALLHNEIAAAQRSSNGPWPSLKQANLRASQLFKPVVAAMQQLAQELAGNEHIRLMISDNDVALALGRERWVRTSRYGWHQAFVVEDTIYCPDLGASYNHTYSFQTPDQVITFIVRACAEFLARHP